MGSISDLNTRLGNRVSLLAPVIQTEEEALARTHRLVRDPIPLDKARLVASGLLGISLPGEQGGADVSNAVLADIVAEFCQADRSIGLLLGAHYRALEIIRSRGSLDQRRFFMARALTGEIFGALGPEVPDQSARAELSRAGAFDLRLTLDVILDPHQTQADWFLIPVSRQDDRDENLAQTAQIIVMSRQAQGLQLSGWHLLADALAIGPDSCLASSHGESAIISAAIDTILLAANALGMARHRIASVKAILRDTNGKQQAGNKQAGNKQAGNKQGGTINHPLSRLGQILTDMAAAAALLDQAGRRADMAQVNADRTEPAASSPDLSGYRARHDLEAMALMALVASQAAAKKARALLDDMDGAPAQNGKDGPRIFHAEPAFDRHLLEQIGRKGLD